MLLNPCDNTTTPMLLNTRSQIIQRKWKVTRIVISFMISLVKHESKISDTAPAFPCVSSTPVPEIQYEPPIELVSPSSSCMPREIEPGSTFNTVDEIEPITANEIEHVLPSNSLVHELEPASSETYHPVFEIEVISSNTLRPDIEIEPVSSFLSQDTRGLSTQFRKLTEIVKKKDSKELSNFGGVVGIARFLKTDTEKGIVGNDLSKRRMMFGSNTPKKPNIKTLICSFVHIVKGNITYHILMVCAILILVFGILIYGAGDGWFDGGGTIIGLFLSAILFAFVNFWIKKQLHKLQISDVEIDVVRNGRRQRVLIIDLVVGDVVFLAVGDQVPTNGLFIDGQPLQVDELSMTGRSDHVQVNSNDNPFLFYGSKVVSGRSRMLVTSVGTYTDRGEKTPLQVRLDELTYYLKKVGILVAFFVLLAQLIYFFTRKAIDDTDYVLNWDAYKKFHIVNSVLAIISQSTSTLLVVDADLELAFELALVNSLRRMSALPVKFQNKASCEIMGSVTVICTNKAGTLTSNKMKVTKCYVGTEEISQDFSRVIANDLLELFYQGVAFNITDKVQNTDSDSLVKYSDSPTEKAILSWAVEYLGMEIDSLKQNYTVLHVETFNSHMKQSGVLIKSNTNNSYYVHWKGAAEMVLAMCSRYYEPTGELKQMNEIERSQFKSIIQGMASSSFQCIAFAQKQIEHKELSFGEDKQVLSQNDLTLLGIIGITDPCRPGARKGIESFRNAGVQTKMITGDNIHTAKAIAMRCGMLEVNQQDVIDQVIEGIEFRNYTPEEQLQKVDNIRVMARSSPEDKLLMVQCLKQKGHVVAITGDGMNDTRVLKEADVGLYMGTQGTGVAKECSDIVILDNDLSSVATVINRERCFYINIQKFIQYQLTIATSTIVINLIAAVSGNDIPLTTFQSLFVEIMGKLVTMVASARPLEDLMHNPPIGRTEPLITNVMWRNILAPAMYLIGVQLTLLFDGSIDDDQVKSTLIFSTTVLCQVFNLFISMMLKKKNVYEWIRKNTLFLGVTGIIIIVLVVMVQFLGTVSGAVRLNLAQWGMCFAIAGVTLPIRLIIKLVPVTEKPFLSYPRAFYTWVINFLW